MTQPRLPQGLKNEYRDLFALVFGASKNHYRIFLTSKRER